MDFSTIEGLVSAFQNGMTLAYLLKNGCTIDQNLRSCVFGQNFDKTSGGYLGHLKPFFGATKGIDGCPLMGTQGFWRQKPILRTSFSQYHILSHRQTLLYIYILTFRVVIILVLHKGDPWISTMENQNNHNPKSENV